MTWRLNARRAISLVEVMLALVVLAVALVPLLTVLSGSRESVADAERFLALLEDVTRAPAAPIDGSRTIVRSSVSTTDRALAFDAVVADPHAGIAPLTAPGEEVR